MHETIDYSRYYDFNQGRDFVAPLHLDGWDLRSVWGLSNRSQTFFAGLWHNGQHTPVPNHALFSGVRSYRWPACIAVDLLEITEHDPLAVVRAMAIAEPSPRLRPASDIAHTAANLPHAAPDFTEGMHAALLWVQGGRRVAPACGIAWPGGAPTAEQVDAEEQMATGRTYDYRLIHRQIFYGGVAAALSWVLGRTPGEILGGASHPAGR